MHISLGRVDLIFGLTKGYWFQYWRQMPFAFKIIDIGCRPFIFAAYFTRPSR